MPKAKRIFELARELNLQSKTILEKCKLEGLDLDSHMSTISVGLEATIRNWFSDQHDDIDDVPVDDKINPFGEPDTDAETIVEGPREKEVIKVGHLKGYGERVPVMAITIDPGSATAEEIGDVLHAISQAYRAIGGSGLTFTTQDIREGVTA